jgi:hypothetical protein
MQVSDVTASMSLYLCSFYQTVACEIGSKCDKVFVT